jgi:hypothetical protein
MNFVEMRLIPLEEMGREIYCRTKGACKQFDELGPNSFPKSCMKLELKETSWCQKIDKGGKQWNT